jgi:choline monooxygenase
MSRPLNELLDLYKADAPLEEAYTIPAPWYVDARIEEAEREQVFGRNWIAVGRLDQVAVEGQFFTIEIAGEPLVIVRGADGELRGFYNVCRHHAAAVANVPCGTVQHLRCPYHGWTYGLDGLLKGAPEFAGVCNFDRGANGLVPVRVAAWEQFVFVSLGADAPELTASLGDLPGRIAALEIGKLHFFARKTYTLACNWKVYVDNYLEGYHIPVVHPSLHKEIDYDSYRVEPHRYSSIQHAPLRPAGTGGAGIDRKYDPTKTNIAEAVYGWIFPNIMLNVYMGQMQVNVVVPISYDRTVVVFEWFATHPPADVATDPDWSRLVAFSDEIQHEDMEICQTVQRNLRSRVYDRGRYSAKREVGVHHFHSLLHEFLT